MPQDGGQRKFRLSRQSLIGSRCAIIVWLGICLLPSAAHAQRGTAVAPTPGPLMISPVPLAQALETRGDLSLQEATIEKALFTIGASWRVNIVVGKDVTGTVSCIYKQTPLREVLDAILLANGYSYRAVGESLVVQKTQDVGSANPLFESAAISIRHGDLQEILEAARLLLSKEGNIRALDSARSIVVVDYADRVNSIRSFVARMEAAASQASGGMPADSYHRLQVSYFHTQYIPVENAREPLSAVLSQAGRLATMPEENRLVVVDYASNIAMVRRVLERIDRPVPQVRITALIYDISLQDVEQLGFNWNSAAKGNNLDANDEPQQVLSLVSPTLTPFTAGAAGGVATIKSLTRNFDINTVLLMLQNANDARLLANPNVTVMENQTADMSSVQQIPFQQITQSELGGQLGTTAFKDVGVTLHVTPSVAADGTIKLVVEQEFSRVAGFTENDNQPIIDTRIANTTVRVGNRKTLVIGGLRQRSDTGDFNGIPFLKDVKFIGPLFRSRNTTVRESELLVFLMPEIVSYEQPPSHREYLAQQTINCRLDRIPVAEGCNDPGCGPDGSCSSEVLPGTLQDDSVPPATEQVVPPHPPQDLYRPVEPQSIPLTSPLPPTAQTNEPKTSRWKLPSFQNPFSDRYRDQGRTEQTEPIVREAPAQAQGPRSVKEDSQALMRLLHSAR